MLTIYIQAVLNRWIQTFWHTLANRVGDKQNKISRKVEILELHTLEYHLAWNRFLIFCHSKIPFGSKLVVSEDFLTTNRKNWPKIQICKITAIWQTWPLATCTSNFKLVQQTLFRDFLTKNGNCPKLTKSAIVRTNSGYL